MSDIWNKIEEFRDKNGLTDEQVAESIPVPINTYRKWRYRNPSRSNLVAVSRLLGIEGSSSSYLFDITKSDSTVATPKHGTTPSQPEVLSTGTKDANNAPDPDTPNSARDASQPSVSPGDRIPTLDTSSNSDRPDNTIHRISEDDAERLLKRHEIIRDPLHGDVWITSLERTIIGSGAFQRLRGLKQLGPTHLVYPGAVHTRFLHSIGTVHCAEVLVQVANLNHTLYEKSYVLNIDHYAHLLIRLYALLHDVAHMAFGHTLENEGNLFPEEWSNQVRAQAYLEDMSPWSIIVPILDFLRDANVDDDAARRLVYDLRTCLIPSNDEHYPMNLDYPFVADIVGNTLCADLLDYLDRDMLFAGLKERSGDRVINYMAVIGVEDPTGSTNTDKNNIGDFTVAEDGKGRIALLTYRFEQEHGPIPSQKMVPKNEILSEAIDLLRRRFALAEKVYFHRTKTAASAMLISAVGSSSRDLAPTFHLSDEAFLSWLEQDSIRRVQHLVEAYKARRLYGQIFRLDYREEKDEPQSRQFWSEMYSNARNPAWRLEKEQQLERFSGLDGGTVVIYCPDRHMNMKEFDMLVQSHPDGAVKKLRDILDSNRRKEMDAINERFNQLWHLQVFVDPDALDVSDHAREDVQNFSAICEELIGFPNDILDLQRRGRRLRDQLATRVIDEYSLAHNTQVPDYHRALVAASRRTDEAEILDIMRQQLANMMQTNDDPNDNERS